MNKMALAVKSAVAGAMMSGLVGVAHAGGALDLSLADESVRIAYDATQTSSGLHINLSGLHDMDDGNMLGAGLHVVDLRNQNKNLFVGVGAKAFLYDTDDYTGAALGVGGFLRANLPTHPDFSFAGYAYYAPPVVSFGDTQNMFNTDWRAQYAVIPSARIFAGYRYNGIRVEGKRDRIEIGDGWHFGVTMDF
ncbi:YfaZ family outer membrane protein [Oceanobacter mangrovi]|uniref:YfaZ family outer membrane protein n=1 Tax=Oceanobacter mangrovi TaxID=2862510 RepID=UPI001C8D9356|nr:YfaZ family outer membrane protein [Oceanobacter mangrovi]